MIKHNTNAMQLRVASLYVLLFWSKRGCVTKCPKCSCCYIKTLWSYMKVVVVEQNVLDRNGLLFFLKMLGSFSKLFWSSDCYFELFWSRYYFITCSEAHQNSKEYRYHQFLLEPSEYVKMDNQFGRCEESKCIEDCCCCYNIGACFLCI